MATGGGLGLLQVREPPSLFCNGLGGRIRTYDLLVPGQVCYRYTTPSLLVSALRFELRPAGTQPAMLPLHHGTDLEPLGGLEPPSDVYKTPALSVELQRLGRDNGSRTRI